MSAKEDMIDKIQTALLNEAHFIRETSTKSTEDKIAEIDVLFDTVKFLKDYDENIKVLRRHLQEKGR